MLNEYDEWYCDACAERKSSVEMVFTPEADLCDTCYEEEE